MRTAPALANGGLATPLAPELTLSSSAVVYIDVDLVGYADRGAVPKAKLSPKYVEKHEDHDDQHNDRKNTAAATATGLDDRRMFAFDVVAIVSH
jgi:hypothetical protein